MIPQSKLEDIKSLNLHPKVRPKSSEKCNMANLAAFSLRGFSEHRIGEEALTHKVREALKVGADPSTESYTEKKSISTLSFLPWFEWEMPAHRPMCLNDCSPVGGVIWVVSDPLGGWALLEEVLGAAFQFTLSVYSHGWQCALSCSSPLLQHWLDAMPPYHQGLSWYCKPE